MNILKAPINLTLTLKGKNDNYLTNTLKTPVYFEVVVLTTTTI